jgi:DNA polymerase-3 subunit delta'
MKEFFSLSQTEYNWRIAIIDAADEMNESSSNAILKLLEEPPNKSIIILISHNYYSLKSTIISRCQKITLRPLSENEMGKFLSKEVNNQEEINLISSLSEGIPSLALNLTNEETLNTYKRLIDLVSNTENSTQSQIFDLIESQKFGNQNEASLDLIDLILILIRRVIRSLLNDEELITNDIESQMFEKIVDQSNMTIILAELYLDLEQTIARAKRINIEKADISLNCLTKLKTVFREKICL